MTSRQLHLLIVGGDSTIGSALAVAARRAGFAVTTTSRRQDCRENGHAYFDLSTAPEGWTLPVPADVVVLCAAQTNLSGCREDPEGTGLINADHSARVIECQNAAGSRGIVLSTNLVFDGDLPAPSVDAPTNPIEAYGRQKARLEAAVSKHADNCVVRLGKVVTPSLAVVAKWLDRWRDGMPAEAFADYHLSPVTMAFVVSVLMAVIEKGVSGIVHATATETVSYATFAHLLCKGLGRDPDALVREMAMPESMRRSGPQPRYTHLDVSGLAGLGFAAPTAERTANALADQIRADDPATHVQRP